LKNASPQQGSKLRVVYSKENPWVYTLAREKKFSCWGTVAVIEWVQTLISWNFSCLSVIWWPVQWVIWLTRPGKRRINNMTGSFLIWLLVVHGRCQLLVVIYLVNSDYEWHFFLGNKSNPVVGLDFRILVIIGDN